MAMIKMWRPDPIIEGFLAFLYCLMCVINCTILILIAIKRKYLIHSSTIFVVNLLTGHVFASIAGLLRALEPDQLDIFFLPSAMAIMTQVACVILALDRLIAVRFPFRYQICPIWLTWSGVALPWIGAIIFYTCGYMLRKTDVLKAIRMVFMVFPSFCLSASCILGVCNVIIFVQARRQIRSISRVRPSISDEVPTRRHIDIENDRKRLRATKRELKAAYICISMAFSLIICWGPMMAVAFMSWSGMPSNRPLISVGLIVGSLNSLCDPILYIGFNHELRKTLKTFCTCKR